MHVTEIGRCVKVIRWFEGDGIVCEGKGMVSEGDGLV